MKPSAKTTDRLLCLASAALLILAFPRTDLSVLAWAGLVPLMFALDGKKPWAAFRCAYLCGFLFFAGTLYWFFNITRWFSAIAALGIVLLFLYLALYFGAFALFYSLFSRRKPLARLFLLPSAWVVLEFIRATLFTGFDWASLGHSQYKNLTFIQIADLTGVFGVSFLVVMINVLLKEFVSAYFVCRTREVREALLASVLAAAVAVTAVFAYGTAHLLSIPDSDEVRPRLTVAVVQPNILQEMKWQESAKALIVEKHIALSRQAAEHDPDLIIWPETSYPDYLWEEHRLFMQVLALVRQIKIPVLLGSVIKEEGNYYNAAVLLSKDAQIVDIYRKGHLVPFGEFIPLRRFIPFLSEVLDIGDFTRGKERTVFPFSAGGKKGGSFSVLVCFEDTVARVARGFVRGGAQLLVNITNDAWFGNTKAPFMHLQSAVFRTVENRRGLVRAANAGVSCFIDQWGEIIHCVEGQSEGRREKTYISGYAMAEMAFSAKETFYTKFGDVFAIFCFGCILVGIVRKKEKITSKSSF